MHIEVPGGVVPPHVRLSQEFSGPTGEVGCRDHESGRGLLPGRRGSLIPGKVPEKGLDVARVDLRLGLDNDLAVRAIRSFEVEEKIHNAVTTAIGAPAGVHLPISR
jgi:hypothetical protein